MSSKHRCVIAWSFANCRRRGPSSFSRSTPGSHISPSAKGLYDGTGSQALRCASARCHSAHPRGADVFLLAEEVVVESAFWSYGGGSKSGCGWCRRDRYDGARLVARSIAIFLDGQVDWVAKISVVRHFRSGFPVEGQCISGERLINCQKAHTRGEKM